MIIGILYIHPITGTEDRLDAPTSGRFSILKQFVTNVTDCNWFCNCYNALFYADVTNVTNFDNVLIINIFNYKKNKLKI